MHKVIILMSYKASTMLKMMRFTLLNMKRNAQRQKSFVSSTLYLIISLIPCPSFDTIDNSSDGDDGDGDGDGTNWKNSKVARCARDKFESFLFVDGIWRQFEWSDKCI